MVCFPSEGVMGIRRCLLRNYAYTVTLIKKKIEINSFLEYYHMTYTGKQNIQAKRSGPSCSKAD